MLKPVKTKWLQELNEKKYNRGDLYLKAKINDVLYHCPVGILAEVLELTKTEHEHKITEAITAYSFAGGNIYYLGKSQLRVIFGPNYNSEYIEFPTEEVVKLLPRINSYDFIQTNPNVLQLELLTDEAGLSYEEAHLLIEALL